MAKSSEKQEEKTVTLDDLQATIDSLGEKNAALLAQNEQLSEKAASFDTMKNSIDTLGKENETLSGTNKKLSTENNARQEEIEALKGSDTANQGKIDLLSEKIDSFDSKFNKRVFEESNALIKVRDHAKNVCPDLEFGEMPIAEIKKAVADKMRPNARNSDPKYVDGVFDVLTTDQVNKMTVDIDAIVSKKHEDAPDYGRKELNESQNRKRDMWKKTG